MFTADRIESDHPFQVGTLGPGGQRISGASTKAAGGAFFLLTYLLMSVSRYLVWELTERSVA